MTGYSPRRRGSILSDMADIAQDLWASVPETVPAEKPTAVRDEPTAPHAPQTAQNPAKSADSAPKATYADEKSLPFTELWKVADEPIDWTEVLSSPIPTDGLVSAEKWALYRISALPLRQPLLEHRVAAVRCKNNRRVVDVRPNRTNQRVRVAAEKAQHHRQQRNHCHCDSDQKNNSFAELDVCFLLRHLPRLPSCGVSGRARMSCS